MTPGDGDEPTPGRSAAGNEAPAAGTEDSAAAAENPPDGTAPESVRAGETAPAAGTEAPVPPDVPSAGSGPAAVRPTPLDWGDEDIPPAPEPAPGGHYPVAALVLLAVGAAALWGASRLTWVTVTSADGLTEPRTDALNGGVWFGALTPLALVLLAAVAAVLATRGWVRRLVGVLVALVAAVSAVPALALLTGSGATEQRAADLAELPGRARVTELVTANGPAALTLAGALAAFGAGLLLARMPAGTRQLSGKYDSPATRKAAATRAVQEPTGGPLPERVLWDALDAGADPTAAEPRADAAATGDTPGALPGNTIHGCPADGNEPGTTGRSGAPGTGDAP